MPILIDTKVIQQAKEKLGERNAEMIASIMGIEDYNPSRKVGRCPNPAHDDSTPSCSYNPKTFSFHCFGCGFTVDVVEALMMKRGKTFNQACQELFAAAEIDYDFTECGLKSKMSYRYPKPEYAPAKDRVYAYWQSRGISPETIDYLDIQEDPHGNTLFQYTDLNDVLVTCKVRKSCKVDKKEGPKCWYLPNSDVTHILYNMNKINTTQPLIITTGEGDCAAAIECGFYNTVSIGGGDQNTSWIGECWDWLQLFDEIILVHDNDDSGKKYVKEVSARLGEYRVKVVNIPLVHIDPEGNRRKIKDLNELLYFEGKEAVQEAINNARESEIPAIVDYTDIAKFDMSDVDGFTTGFYDLDNAIDKFYVGTTTVLTGVTGCVDCETEYFTGEGWKKISDFEDGDQVLQYNLDGTANMVTPIMYYKIPCEEFWHIHNLTGINQCVSDDHNLVYLTSKGNIYKQNALDFVERHNKSTCGAQGRFITTFTYDGPGIDLTDEELRVMCAVICDGSFPNNTTRCRVNIKKERKKQRLRMLLEQADIKYSESNYNPSDAEYRTFYFYAPLRLKEFPKEWYQCSNHQLQIIAEEAVFWDGSKKDNRIGFSSNVQQTAEFMQFVFSSTGKRSRLSARDRRGETRGKYVRKSIDYHVSATPRNLCSFVRNKNTKNKIEKIKTGDGYKYCFTVPSGMLVLRRDGIINITGNSGKSSFLSTLACQSIEQGFPCFIYSGELSNVSLKNWIDSVHAGQRNINKYENLKNGASTYYKIKAGAYDKINKFYKGQMYFYRDGFEHKTSRLLATMESVVRKHGVRTIIIDNMSSVDLENNDDNKWVKQDEFVRSLIEFSKKWQVVVIVVLHPKKMDTVRRMSIFDLQGCVSAVNLAHRVLSLYRVSKKDKEGITSQNGKVITPPIRHDVMIDVLKDRFGSGGGKTAGLFYDIPSKRFFTTRENLDYQYAWDQTDYGDEPLPFGCPQLDDEEEQFGAQIRERSAYT